MAGEPGRTSQNIAILQVLAKIQELLMVASLATVLLERLRHDMIRGPGVPYGLLGVTSLFSQSSYFWSSIFAGSISRRAWLNRELFVLILVSGFLAATAGPAVAVLLIPREHTWPAGGTTWWLNGTSDDL
jgi:uncharacterized membrane protein